MTVRNEKLRSRLQAPSIGSRHRQFEIQLARLEMLTQREGPIECLFVGNSMVWLDLNPEAFSRAYKAETGEDITCFNFGVGTMPASGAGKIAQILVEDYQPQLLIFGTSARDYAIPEGAEDASVILDTPWVKYRTGKRSIQGWLFVNSYLYRYKEQLARLLKFDRSALTPDYGINSHAQHGFDPKTDIAKEINIAASKKDARKWLYDYQIHPENITGLEQVVNQSKFDVQVFIVELPVLPAYYEGFQNGKKDYERFLEMVENILASSEISLWHTTDLNLIPEDGWWNYNHLNLKGANILSEWLGHQVGMRNSGVNLEE